MSKAIEIENLYKEYRLGVINHGVLFRDLQSWWAQLRGKEDPNSLLSEINKKTSSSELKSHFLALKDISLTINQGEAVGIIGRNGAGKSTLLKLISEITSPTKGRIKINGRLASLLEVGTGFHPELTGRENIYMNGAILGMSRNEINTKIKEIIEFAELEKFIDTPVKRYSSGMYVRLAFSVAAHLDAEILLIDEVLAVGDLEFQKKCLGQMDKAAKKQGRTILFVSHNMGAISSLCKRVIYLRQGELVKDGKTEPVIESYVKGELEGHTEKKLIANIADLPRGKEYQNIIQSAWLENKHGEKVKDALLGEEINICFQYKTTQPISPCFAFGLNNFYGQRIASFESYIISNKKFPDKDQGVAKLNIPELYLLPGKYTISFSIATRKTPHIGLDYVENAMNFNVVSNDIFRTGKIYGPQHGVVVIKGNISLK